MSPTHTINRPQAVQVKVVERPPAPQSNGFVPLLAMVLLFGMFVLFMLYVVPHMRDWRFDWFMSDESKQDFVVFDDYGQQDRPQQSESVKEAVSTTCNWVFTVDSGSYEQGGNVVGTTCVPTATNR